MAAAPLADEERIRQVLQEPTTIEFIETPFARAIESLKELHQIPIEIDMKALDDVEIPADAPITRVLKGVSLQTALRLLLRDLSLAYRVEDEVLVITTAEEAAKHPSTRVYPVIDLLPANATSADAITQLVRATLQRPSEGGPPPLVQQYGPLLIVRGTEETHLEVEALLQRIARGLAALQPQSPPGSDPFSGQ
jgi:hypothetical protein